MASSSNKKPRLSPFEKSLTAFLKAKGDLPPNMAHYISSSSSSSSSSDSDYPPSPQNATILDDMNPMVWDWKITESICKKSGVMHFPKAAANKIPGSMKTITLHYNAANKTYECSINTAYRSRGEKYLIGKEWLRFVKEENLKVRDILKMSIGGTLPNLFVDVVRV